MRIFQSPEGDYTHDKITAMFKSSRKTRGLSRGLQQIVLHSRRPGIPHNSLTLRNVIKNPEKEGRKWDIPLISRIMQPFCQRFLKRSASIAPWEMPSRQERDTAKASSALEHSYEHFP
jgi:hypothetical protein